MLFQFLPTPKYLNISVAAYFFWQQAGHDILKGLFNEIWTVKMNCVMAGVVNISVDILCDAI